MEDKTISLNAVLEKAFTLKFKDMQYMTITEEFVNVKDIMQLSSVTPQEPKWIPVSERLPEKDKYTEFYECLVAVLYTSRHNICKTVSAYFDGKHFYRNKFDRAFISEVKAWMPLPEPYELQESEE